MDEKSSNFANIIMWKVLYNIGKLCEKKEVRFSELADETGLSADYLRKSIRMAVNDEKDHLVNKYKSIQFPAIYLCAEYLGVSIDALLGEREDSVDVFTIKLLNELRERTASSFKDHLEWMNVSEKELYKIYAGEESPVSSFRKITDNRERIYRSAFVDADNLVVEGQIVRAEIESKFTESFDDALHLYSDIFNAARDTECCEEGYKKAINSWNTWIYIIPVQNRTSGKGHSEIYMVKNYGVETYKDDDYQHDERVSIINSVAIIDKDISETAVLEAFSKLNLEIERSIHKVSKETQEELRAILGF